MASIAANWATATWEMAREASPWLLLGFLLGGVLHVALPVEWTTRHLSRGGWRGVWKASLLGIPLPLCSCGVIPVATAIRRRGASRGAFASFLISTPETGVDSIAISYALLGPVLTIARPIAAFTSAILAGLLIQRFPAKASAPPSDDEQAGSEAACPGQSCVCEEAPAVLRPGRLAGALRHGLVDMFVDLAPWLVAGFVLAGLAATLVPDDFFALRVGHGPATMIVMLLIGIPLYVCATSSTPLAAALIARGLSPGAALVFLLVGPATNIATMLIVVRELGRRGLALYLLSIAGIAVAFGLGLDAFLARAPEFVAAPSPGSPESAGLLPNAAAFVVLLLTLNGLRVRWMRSVSAGRA